MMIDIDKLKKLEKRASIRNSIIIAIIIIVIAIVFHFSMEKIRVAEGTLYYLYFFIYGIVLIVIYLGCLFNTLELDLTRFGTCITFQVVAIISLIIGLFLQASWYYSYLRVVVFVSGIYVLLIKPTLYFGGYTLEFNFRCLGIFNWVRHEWSTIFIRSLKKWNWGNLLFLGLLVCYNNIIPIYFKDRVVWQILDILCIGIFLHRLSIIINILTPLNQNKKFGFISSYLREKIINRVSRGKGYIVEKFNLSNDSEYAVIIRFINGSPLYFRVNKADEDLTLSVCSISESNLNYEFCIEEEEKPYGDIFIPAEISYRSKVYRVTEIDSSAFAYCSSLTHIEIPNTIESIGGAVFIGCNVLDQLKIPNSVKELGVCNLNECYNLREVYIPDSIPFDNRWYISLKNCFSLDKIHLPSMMKRMLPNMFENCKSLKRIKIPELVEVIEAEAFVNCELLVNVEMSDEVKHIKYAAFKNCCLLKEIKLSNSIISIANESFFNCSSLIHINIPKSIQSIGLHVFDNCSSLSEVVLPNRNVEYKDISRFPLMSDYSQFNAKNNLNQYSYTDSIPSHTKIIYEHDDMEDVVY